MNGSARDRGSVLVLTLAVVTALGLTTATLLEATSTYLRREQTAWSATVALADALSAETWWVGELRAHPTITCTDLQTRPAPSLANGSTLTVECQGGPPVAWSVTVSATNGRRRSTVAFTVSAVEEGSLSVHARSVTTEPSPAFTNAA